MILKFFRFFLGFYSFELPFLHAQSQSFKSKLKTAEVIYGIINLKKCKKKTQMQKRVCKNKSTINKKMAFSYPRLKIVDLRLSQPK